MESIKMLLISCIALVLLPFSSKLSAQSIKRLDGSSIRFDQLDHTIKELMNTAKVTGLSVAVFNKNKPVYIKSYGYADISTQKKMDTATIYWSCSLSKAMFAYIVLKMADKGIINLDTPLVQYLKKPLYEYAFTKKTRGYQDIKEDKRYEKITARMCLNHTTGLPNYRGFETDGKLRIKYDPGTRFSYSGEGMYLLQFVLEQITGKDILKFASEEFKSLKENIKYIPAKTAYFSWANGQIFTTAGTESMMGQCLAFAGVKNVTPSKIDMPNINAETLVSWNPDIIYMWNDSPSLFYNNPQLATVGAIKNKKIYNLMPMFLYNPHNLKALLTSLRIQNWAYQIHSPGEINKLLEHYLINLYGNENGKKLYESMEKYNR